MLARSLIHLPWAGTLALLTAVLCIEVFLARPREAEAAREAAVESIRASLARDLSLIESSIHDGAIQQVREFVSASSALSGLDEMIVVAPGGLVLASSDIALEGRPLPEGEPYATLGTRLGADLLTEIARAPHSNQVETWASISFPQPDRGIRGRSQGLLYVRWNLEPTVAPMTNATRSMAVHLILLLILTAIPLQVLVYWFVTRRLQHLAVDAQAFGAGRREGLFRDTLQDQIGVISALLREATTEVAGREVAAQRLELALESASAGIWDWDMVGRTIETNDQYHLILGDAPLEGPQPAEEIIARVHPDDIERVRAAIRATVKREEALYDVEFRMRNLSDGLYTWIRSTGRVVAWSPSGRALRMLGQHINITEQKLLRAHEASLARIVDDSPSEVYIVAADSLRVLSANQAALRNTGYEANEILNLTVCDLTAPEDRPALEKALAGLGRGDALYIRQISRNLRRDGSTYEIEALIQYQTFDEQPAFVVTIQDISDRALMQRRFQKLFDTFSHPIYVFDRDVRFIMTNPAGARLFHVDAAELAGRVLDDLIPDLHALTRERIAVALETKSGTEYEDRLLIGGAFHWFHSILQPVEDDRGHLEWVQIIAYDITERKESELALYAQQERYRTLVETTSAILWEGDPVSFNITFVNQEAEKVLGYPAEQWTEDPGFWVSHIHPADRDWAVSYCVTATNKCEEHSFEYRMIASDGRIVWLRDIVSVIAENGRPVKLVGVMVDISREKREEERLHAAFDSIPIGNIVIDQRGTILLANPAAQEMFGYTLDELTGNNVSMLMPEPDHSQHDQYLRNYLGTGISKIMGSTRDVTGLRKNGDHFPVRLALGEMRYAEHRNFVGSVIDLSHVRNLEAQLLQSQKMEAIGQLAGGIAHDFNNLLHVINGFTEIAREGLPEDAPVQLELSQIALAGERAAALTGQLLAFSRRQVMQPDNLDVNQVIGNMGAMLRRVIGEHIQMDVLACPRLGRVYADRGMLEQVLMNLCVNARDAMAGGGRLNIETENVVISEEYCRDHMWAKPGRYVLVSVTDTGCGMDKDTISRVFEPFFTTKGMHEGTGLGLAMVYGIVKQHDGMINVYSEPGKGTTFKVYLPHSERAAEDVGTKIEGEVPRGTETILVVEDDEAVRGLSRNVLESAGYIVLEAEDGMRAVQVFRENLDRIDLALMDVVMPGMGGREAYNEMLKIAPQLKALFASGYSENAIHTNFVLDSGLALLKKPYSRDDLLRAVRRLLDQ